MSIISDIACITGGILLGIETLDKWDGAKDFFKKAESFLLPYNTIIGGALFISNIINIFNQRCLIYNIIGIAAGLLLFTDVLKKIPTLGDLITKASAILLPFKAVLGIAILVIGIMGLFGLRLFC